MAGGVDDERHPLRDLPHGLRVGVGATQLKATCPQTRHAQSRDVSHRRHHQGHSPSEGPRPSRGDEGHGDNGPDDAERIQFMVHARDERQEHRHPQHPAMPDVRPALGPQEKDGHDPQRQTPHVADVRSDEHDRVAAHVWVKADEHHRYEKCTHTCQEVSTGRHHSPQVPNERPQHEPQCQRHGQRRDHQRYSDPSPHGHDELHHHVRETAIALRQVIACKRHKT